VWLWIDEIALALRYVHENGYAVKPLAVDALCLAPFEDMALLRSMDLVPLEDSARVVSSRTKAPTSSWRTSGICWRRLTVPTPKSLSVRWSTVWVSWRDWSCAQTQALASQLEMVYAMNALRNLAVALPTEAPQSV
jgi:hypothetical protein